MSLSDLVSKVAPKQLFSDEPVAWGQEITRVTAGVLVRIQRVGVVRDDNLVVFERIMGRADEFPSAPRVINVPAFMLYNAGEMQDLLDEARGDKIPESEPHDLIGDYIKQADEVAQLAAHRTVVGPNITVQRS